MNINQGFSYTGSSEYNFSNVSIQSNGVALFDSLTGIGGIDYVPADGDTVTMVAGFNSDPKTDIRQFSPTMNNSAYYLVTDVEYNVNDRDTILSLATSIPMAYNPVSKRYEGTFTFSNPDDLPNLYLIWDYTDNLDSGSITYTGKRTDRVVDINYGTNRGIAGVDYSTISKPVRFQLKWNNVTVGDTGYIGLNSLSNYNNLIAKGIDPSLIKLSYPYNGLVNNGTGQLRFNKFSTVSDAYLLISAPLDSNAFGANRIDPALTDFFMNPTPSNITTVCTLIATDKYRHDGDNPLPTIGDRIYVDSSGATLFDGGNNYYQISLLGDSWITIDSNGVVTSQGSCGCAEVAVPVITPQGFVFTTNQSVNVAIQATNNPTSWDVVASCDEYLLDGGTTGTIFTIDDCKYGSTTITLNIGQTKLVCSSAAPVIVGGDGSFTSNGPCLTYILPKGLSIDLATGIISGTVSDECDFSFDINATNCFGTSITETITISIVASSKFKPFLIDIENFGTDSATACALSMPLYSVLYHNGLGDVPTTGDFILRVYDAQGNATPFFGGGMWYNVYNSTDVIKICETGKVCDSHTCP